MRHVFSITNIDKEAPVIDYAAIEAAKGYKREIPLNEGEEYTEEQLIRDVHKTGVGKR